MAASSIWDKVDLTVLAERANVTQSSSRKSRHAARKRRKLKRTIWILDFIAILLWVYALSKLFVFDVDEYILARIAPGMMEALNYRVFIFLLAFTFVVIFFRRYYLGMAYILFFPLVVLVWKIPRLVYRTRSWVAALGVINMAATLIRDFKFNLVALTATAISVVLVAVSDKAYILVPAVLVLVAVLLWTSVRVVKCSLTPSRFLSLQQKLIDRAASSTFIAQVTEVNSELRKAEVERFNHTQLSTFQASLSTAILVCKFSYYWAYQLECYRRSALIHLFGTLSYFRLFIQTALTFALANYALLKASPESFSFDSQPTFIRVFWYSLSALFVNGIDGLAPASDMAIVIVVVQGVSGPLILSMLVLHYVQSFRQARRESEIKEVVAKIKANGDLLEVRLREQYEVGADEAWVRLQAFGQGAFSTAIEYLLARIPVDFLRVPD
ncbi:hypothetical protein AB0C27_07900 [Nonomuraea sp. NPDC048882]|uniref:hypothetical protein n=1 Tax=Nonomuraea sp. NPDC048882 TaxID=3154347 RepID=UPI0034056277